MKNPGQLGRLAQLRPDYTALLTVADGLRPGPNDEASEAIPVAAERRAPSQLAGSPPEDLPQGAQWREAFRASAPSRTASPRWSTRNRWR